jgi:glycosyltransferase involved in cell wall biosynthesis
MLNKLNIVFMPISIYKGMASTKRLNNYLPKLDEEGIEYHSIVLTSDGSLQSNSKELVIYYQGIISRIYAQFKVLLKFWELKKRNYKNVLYYYDYPSIINFHLILFAKLIGYKIIFDIVEDNNTITNSKSSISSFRIATSLFLIKRIKHFSDGVIVISNHLHQMISSYIHKSIPIIDIPISINKAEFEVLKKNHNSTQKLKIFYGGSFGEKDGLPLLLEAFDEVCKNYNCSLIITGKGSERDMKIFYTKLNGLENKNRVKYWGYLSREDYISQLYAADIFSMNRTNSAFANAGFPFKLGEMLAAGSPVICTRVGDISHYLTHSENAFIIDPDNKTQLVNAIIYLINNPKERERTGKAGRAISFELFDGDRQSERFIQFCYSL